MDSLCDDASVTACDGSLGLVDCDKDLRTGALAFFP